MDRGLKVVLSALLVSTIAFLAISPFATSTTVTQDYDTNRILRFVAQAVVMIVCFAVFFIQWLPPRQLRNTLAIFIATAFLSVGILTSAHILTCARLLDIAGDTESRAGSFFHMMVGLTVALSLLVAAFIPTERRVRKGESSLLLLSFLAYTSIVVLVGFLFSSSFPTLCPHEAPADPTRIIVETAAIIALAVAALRYVILNRMVKDAMFSYLACAAVLGAYSHLAFSLHERPLDLFSALAEILVIACFVLVFMALFSSAVVQPYAKLTMAQDQAEKRRKEAETATVRAQIYLDFLSHDVANMISPIMSRAEMILQSPHSSEDNRKEAGKIVEQTQKVSSLIVNLRRLSSAERIDAKMLGPVDLRTFLSDIQKTSKEVCPQKDAAVVVNYPENADVKVMGGSVVEDMITEFVDNAIKHSGKKRVRVEITVSPAQGEMREDYWAIEILDDGPGIPDHIKHALDVTSSDPKRRFTRGVASSLSIMHLVAEQLGGIVRIEDRVPGDHTKGTKVTLILLKAA